MVDTVTLYKPGDRAWLYGAHPHHPTTFDELCHRLQTPLPPDNASRAGALVEIVEITRAHDPVCQAQGDMCPRGCTSYVIRDQPYRACRANAAAMALHPQEVVVRAVGALDGAGVTHQISASWLLPVLPSSCEPVIQPGLVRLVPGVPDAAVAIIYSQLGFAWPRRGQGSQRVELALPEAVRIMRPTMTAMGMVRAAQIEPRCGVAVMSRIGYIQAAAGVPLEWLTPGRYSS